MNGGVLEAFNRLLGHHADRDGQASALEELSVEPEDAISSGGPARRDRGLGLPQEILQRALAQKILDGWLQNRNQVLVPLTLRLGQLRADDVELLMRFAAASLHLASSADQEAQAAVTRWLRSIGAVENAIVVFERALQAPSALNTLLDRVLARHLDAYAYAIAAMAADLRVVSGRLYADFVAARLALPADAVRSINRRFRR
ncbi:hypothetical protein [Lichenifustis flavocetrariae]|uniref:Uncharacterized protein n=1 Tax=Lichenifustis flavocetrariae TaxID=2949735 RepID=A0AA42CLX0_9HYPH|nr:hypothetical protein [Lichenifustis flavocetrariae]MCW6507760.1 hypothetical protein [Lichenifustis flavocetrariae]